MARTPPKIDFSGKVAIVADAATEAAIFESPSAIGKVVFFQVSDDLRIPPERLLEKLDEYGIDRAFAPKDIDPRAQLLELLKKAKRSNIVIGRRAYDLLSRVREKEGGALVAELVRMRHIGSNDSGANWEAITVAEIGWHPDYPDVIAPHIKSQYASEYPYHEIISVIEEEFADRLAHHTGKVVSRILSQILNDTMSVSSRPAGGVWLVPREHIELLSRVQEFVKDIDANFRRPEGGETFFESVILHDGEVNQLFIRGQVETQVVRDLQHAVDALRELAKRKVPARPTQLAKAADIRRAALSLRDHYAQVVGPDFKRVSEALEVFDYYWAQAATGGEAAPVEEGQ